jgi:hypothetical protein
MICVHAHYAIILCDVFVRSLSPSPKGGYYQAASILESRQHRESQRLPAL